jgi:hypothetical protein
MESDQLCVSLSLYVHRLSVPIEVFNQRKATKKMKRQHPGHLLAESQLALITELCTM